jgi:hypothetical protein
VDAMKIERLFQVLFVAGASSTIGVTSCSSGDDKSTSPDSGAGARNVDGSLCNCTMDNEFPDSGWSYCGGCCCWLTPGRKAPPDLIPNCREDPNVPAPCCEGRGPDAFDASGIMIKEGGKSKPATCGSTTCQGREVITPPDANVPTMGFSVVDACCRYGKDNDTCGVFLQLLCFNTSPGTSDPKCPDSDELGNHLKGCCTPSHVCGVDFSTIFAGLAGCDEVAPIYKYKQTKDGGLKEAGAPIPCGTD